MGPAGLAAGDIVVAPFPCTDLPVQRRRPALVLSAGWNAATGHMLAAMVTSAQRSHWPGDVVIGDLAAAGLTQPCLVRLKLFTLETLLVQRVAGRLAATDAVAVRDALAALLPARLST